MTSSEALLHHLTLLTKINDQLLNNLVRYVNDKFVSLRNVFGRDWFVSSLVSSCSSAQRCRNNLVRARNSRLDPAVETWNIPQLNS